MSGCRLAGVVLTIAVAVAVFWGCRKERGTWIYEPSPPPPRAPVVTPEKVRVPRPPILSGASEQPPPPPKPAPAIPAKPK